MRDLKGQYRVGRFEGTVDEQIRRMCRRRLRAPRPWAVAEREPDYVPIPDEEADAE